MFDDQIYIRIVEHGAAFVYTIRRSGQTIESGQVPTTEEVAPGYYGGSEVME